MADVEGYLVLTRNIGKSIMIGDNIEVRVLGVRGKHAKIGIVASRDIAIHRKEIWDRIQEEKEGDVK